jgi:hypothetical protein
MCGVEVKVTVVEVVVKSDGDGSCSGGYRG